MCNAIWESTCQVGLDYSLGIVPSTDVMQAWVTFKKISKKNKNECIIQSDLYTVAKSSGQCLGIQNVTGSEFSNSLPTSSIGDIKKNTHPLHSKVLL